MLDIQLCPTRTGARVGEPRSKAAELTALPRPGRICSCRAASRAGKTWNGPRHPTFGAPLALSFQLCASQNTRDPGGFARGPLAGACSLSVLNLHRVEL